MTLVQALYDSFKILTVDPDQSQIPMTHARGSDETGCLLHFASDICKPVTVVDQPFGRR